MKKLYATIQPAYIFVGDGLADLPFLFIAPYHFINYERVCGYSLGHDVTFFDSLQEAQKQFGIELKKNEISQYYFQRQNALIELDVKEDKIIRFIKIHTIEKMKPIFKIIDDENGYFEKRYVPVWNIKPIQLDDLSNGALNEINAHYKLYINPEPQEPSFIEWLINKSIEQVAHLPTVVGNYFDHLMNTLTSSCIEYAVDVVDNCPSYFQKSSINNPSSFFKSNDMCLLNESAPQIASSAVCYLGK